MPLQRLGRNTYTIGGKGKTFRQMQVEYYTMAGVVKSEMGVVFPFQWYGCLDIIDKVKATKFYRQGVKQGLNGYIREMRLKRTHLINPPHSVGRLFHVADFTKRTLSKFREGITNEDYYDLVLASVRIGKAVTTITDEVITDRRNNNNYCGYVAGVVSQIDTTDLFSQFTAAFNSWFAELKESIKYDTDRFTVLFDAWFDSIRGKLEGDQATALQLQIDALTESTTKGIYGFENKQTIENSDGSISEIYGDGRKVVTVEETDGSITQKYYDSSGSLKYTKTIVEDSTGKITETII